MGACFSLHQLTGHSELSPRLPHASFKNIAYAKHPPDIAHIDALALEDKGGVARDHEQGTEA
jgi:hypothetical protein